MVRLSRLRTSRVKRWSAFDVVVLYVHPGFRGGDRMDGLLRRLG